jgi:2-hydroxyglutarate dehydrogenase
VTTATTEPAGASTSAGELPSECDLAIVGAGIIGLASARELIRRQPDARIVVLEREPEVARHQTGSNSGVIHAGIYYKPGSLKARLCVEGSRLMYEFCEQHAIPFERCGKLIVALDESELPGLDELETRGRANGVPGLRRVGPEELHELEPHAAGIAALHSPATGIVDFGAVARALAGELREAGVTVATGCEVAALQRRAGGDLALTHAGGELRARRALVCAGGWSDRLALAAGAGADPRIIPFRGAYLRLRPQARTLVRGLIYPVPDPELPFLGVHLTKRIDGEVLLGPTALLVGALDAYSLRRVSARDLRATLAWPGTWRMAAHFWRSGLSEMRMAASRRAFFAACARYVPELTEEDLLDGPAGVRAQAVGRDGALVDDFLIDEADGALYVRNAPSPAATSSLALAGLIADRAQA